MCRYVRVTSPWVVPRMCLDVRAQSVDDLCMEPTDRIFRNTCCRCQRPALTFDQEARPLCSRHAIVFVGVPRVLEKDDEWWNDAASVKASLLN